MLSLQKILCLLLTAHAVILNAIEFVVFENFKHTLIQKVVRHDWGPDQQCPGHKINNFV